MEEKIIGLYNLAETAVPKAAALMPKDFCNLGKKVFDVTPIQTAVFYFCSLFS